MLRTGERKVDFFLPFFPCVVFSPPVTMFEWRLSWLTYLFFSLSGFIYCILSFLLFLSIYLFIQLVSLSLFLSVCSFVCSFVYICVSFPICLSFYLSIYFSSSLSIYLYHSIYLSLHVCNRIYQENIKYLSNMGLKASKLTFIISLSYETFALIRDDRLRVCSLTTYVLGSRGRTAMTKGMTMTSEWEG